MLWIRRKACLDREKGENQGELGADDAGVPWLPPIAPCSGSHHERREGYTDCRQLLVRTRRGTLEQPRAQGRKQGLQEGQRVAMQALQGSFCTPPTYT